LGRLYFRTRQYEKAEPLYRRALEVWKKGSDDCLAIAAVLKDLGTLYWAEGKLDRCEELYRRAIPLLEKRLGDEQPEFLASQKAWLAGVLASRNQDAEALALLEEVTATMQRSTLSSSRDSLLTYLSNELTILTRLHRDTDAARIQKQIDALQSIKSQAADPLTRWQGLTGTAYQITDPAQHMAVLQQALSAAKELPPGQELDQTLNLLATTALQMRRNDQAEDYLRQAVAASEQAFGKDSVQTAHNLDALASTLALQKKDAEATQAFQRALVILRKSPGEELFLCLVEQHLANLYSAGKNYAEAESECIHALQAAEAAPHRDEGWVDGAVERLGLLYKNWGKYDQAVPYCVRSVKMMEARSASVSASRLANYLAMLSDLMRRLNRPDEAQQYEDRRKRLVELPSSKTSTSAAQ
jgi:tetratricopeptide (TPR) repeat protein